jgi:hypothetical protein
MRRGLRAALCVLLMTLGSCSTLVEYTDSLVDNNTGRTNFVTKPASVFGVVGFVLGIPLDIVALPVTYTVYLSQSSDESDGVDPLSTLLFPSFVLWRGGVLVVGAPLDALEFTFYRAWTRDTEGSREDYERDLERELDEEDRKRGRGELGSVDPRNEG